MANEDQPQGFWPIRHNSGGEIRTEERIIDSNTASALFRGDAIANEAAGNIEALAADDGLIACGVFAGCSYVDADGDLHRSDYIPADKTGFTEMKAYIWGDKNIVYGVQADSGTALTAACIGATANHVAGSGDTDRKLSGHELDSSDVGTGAQFTILGKVRAPNNAWGEHVNLEVIFNEHVHKAAVAGV